jgi:hypothetical protein
MEKHNARFFVHHVLMDSENVELVLDQRFQQHAISAADLALVTLGAVLGGTSATSC